MLSIKFRRHSAKALYLEPCVCYRPSSGNTKNQSCFQELSNQRLKHILVTDPHGLGVELGDVLHFGGPYFLQMIPISMELIGYPCVPSDTGDELNM